MAISKRAKQLYEFGPFSLDAAERILFRDGQPMPLTPKAFDLLLVLVENSGHLVGKDELMQRLWPGAFVEEANLPNNISLLRKALGDDTSGHQYIETVPRRGYRFVAKVMELSSEPAELIVEEHTRATLTLEQESKEDLQQVATFPAHASVKRLIIWVVVALIIVLGIAWAAYYFLYKPEAASAPIRSIAVLPFELSGAEPNSDEEYLSDGMTESILNSLTQLSDLRVIARSTVFRYKGKKPDPVVVGKELGVQTVLVGRLLQRGDSLMISTELMDVRDNKQIWGERYNRKMTDLLALQGEIARDVTNKLRVKLSGSDEQRLLKNYTENVEAYRLYLKARFYWNRRTPKDVERAIEACQQAIAIDPNYAPAYAGLSDAYSLPPFGASPRERMSKARDAALKALSLDDNLAEAHTALGRILLYHDYNFTAAEREYRRAIELDPNSAIAHHRYGEVLGILGRHQESSAEFLRSLELDPLSINFNANYGIFLIFARRYDDAIAQLKKALELDERALPTHAWLGLAYKLTGNYAESVEEHAKMMEVIENYQEAALARESFAKGGWEGFLRYITSDSRRFEQSQYDAATCYAALGEKDKAITALNKAYENREISMAVLKVDPQLDILRSDPRFTDIMRRIGFEQGR